MKIVYIFQSFAEKGGTERIFSDKMNYLADVLGYDVTFITYEQGNHAPTFPLSDKIHYIDLDTRFFTLSALPVWKRLGAYRKMYQTFAERLKQTLAEINPDIVAITTYSCRLFGAVMRLPYHIVVESHVSYENINESGTHNSNPIVGWLIQKHMRYCLRNAKKADRIVLLTDRDQQAWKNYPNTMVIPNVVTCYPEEINDLATRPKRIIAVGRLHHQKGFDMLIEAWRMLYRKYPDWIVDIYGDSTNRDFFQRLIDQKQMQNAIHLRGRTSDVYKEYQESAFYVMSSRYEGFGLVLVEAMSCGLPCVSFDCPYGPSTIISDGEDGFLVDNGNVKQLAEKMEILINDANLRMAMGQKAREKAALYKKENIMGRWDALFKSLIENHQ